MWYKVKWIDPLFAAFNTVFPQRTKASDGSIGDLIHSEEVSGHNPDDTYGVQAERTDADSIPEVRAADVTSDLRDSRGIKMYDVVQRMLLPVFRVELNRLIYIICDGWIWRKRTGWVREVHLGSDKHYGHAHFSGDPESDEDSSPWNSILSIGDNDMTPEQANILLRVDERIGTLIAMLPKVPSNGEANKLGNAINDLAAGGVTQDMLNGAMVHALQQPEVLAALAPVIENNAFRAAQRAEQE